MMLEPEDHALMSRLLDAYAQTEDPDMVLVGQVAYRLQRDQIESGVDDPRNGTYYDHRLYYITAPHIEKALSTEITAPVWGKHVRDMLSDIIANFDHEPSYLGAWEIELLDTSDRLSPDSVVHLVIDHEGEIDSCVIVLGAGDPESVRSEYPKSKGYTVYTDVSLDACGCYDWAPTMGAR